MPIAIKNQTLAEKLLDPSLLAPYTEEGGGPGLPPPLLRPTEPMENNRRAAAGWRTSPGALGGEEERERQGNKYGRLRARV